PARANGNGSLGQSLARNQRGGYVTGGTGFCAVSPCSGGGTITISGVPAGSTITDAFVYWNTISAASFSGPLTGAAPVGGPPGPRNPSAPAFTGQTENGSVNGQAVTGSLIGQGTTGNGFDVGVYRASLPAAAMPSGGNGTYALSGFRATT